MGNMPHISWDEVSIRSRHGDRLLQLYFSAQKAASKAQKYDRFQFYLYKISKLIRSDPALARYIYINKNLF